MVQHFTHVLVFLELNIDRQPDARTHTRMDRQRGR